MSLTIQTNSLADVFLPSFRASQHSLDVMRREMRKACDANHRKPTTANEAKFNAFVTAFCAVERDRDDTVRKIVERGGLLLCV